MWYDTISVLCEGMHMGIVVRDKKFPSATGICDIRYRIWTPDEPRACVQIIHDMADHIERYHQFAMFLAENGFLVFGMDLPGHGKSIGKDQPKGYFGDQNGWDNLIKDNKTMHDAVMKDHPSMACILFGHSMGSFLARAYAGRMGVDFDAFIFSGTAGSSPMVPVQKMIAKSAIKKGKGKLPNEKLNKLVFGAYNKKFRDPRTEFDWLSRDTASVDRYLEDPLCGFIFTSCGFYDLFTGLSEVSNLNWAKRVPNRPIFLLSGSNDPVGNMGKGVKQVNQWLLKSNHTITMKLYPEGRHEMLNETNRKEVYGDVLLFIEMICAAGEQE